MSRAYIIALFVLVSSLFGGLVYLHFQLLDRQMEAQYAQAAPVLAAAIEQKEERIGWVVYEFAEKLELPHKEKFVPILPAIEEVLKLQEEFLAEVREAKKVVAKSNSDNNLSTSTELLQKYRRARKETVLIMSRLLDDFGEQMDLRQEDIETKKQSYLKEISAPNFHFSGYENQLFFQNELELLELVVLNLREYVVEDLTQIAGGKALRCFLGPKYRPVIHPDFLNAKRGDSLSAVITLSTYTDPLPEEMVQIVIAGDTMSLNNWDQIDYHFVPKKRGKQDLAVELIFTNRFTGERQSRYSWYTYYAD